MRALTQARQEMLNSGEISDFLSQAVEEQSPVIASYLCDGKWHLLELRATGFTDDFIAFQAHTPCESLKIEQPVGICVHLGYFKYLFDTSVQAIESESRFCRVVLELPNRVERIERRLFHRQPVPTDMKVKVLFWHRGYLDDTCEKPKELYWEGRLLNLSAGGAQFEIESRQKEHFKVGQLLGIQFTPLSYQKPLLLDSHVRYLKDQSENGHFHIGVEFLGLEASPEGRQILKRILDVIGVYQAMGKSDESALA